VSERQVLVTCRDSGQLRLFTTDGQLLQQIQLDTDVAVPNHAVLLWPSRSDMTYHVGGQFVPAQR